jgi:hypothetical protein
LQSPNWWSWRRAIEYVREWMGAGDIHTSDSTTATADFDLAAAINKQNVRIKLEAVDYRSAPPKRISTLLDEKNFFPHFTVEPRRGLLVRALAPNTRPPPGSTFYAWGPDLQRIWPGPAPEADTTSSRSVLRQPSGPKTARRWQDHVLREIARASYEMRPRPTASELARSCSEHVGVTPDTSQINEFLRRVRTGQ